MRVHFLQQFDQALLAEAEMLTAQFVQEEGEPILEFDEGELAPPRFYSLQDSKGNFLYSAGGLGTESQGEAFVPWPETSFENFDLPKGIDGRLLRMVIRPRLEALEDAPEDEPLVYGEEHWLVLAAPLTTMKGFLDSVLLVMIAGGSLLLFMVGVLTWNGVRSGLGPLARFSDRLRGLHESNLDWSPSEEELPSDIALMEQEMQNLVQRLKDAFSRERRFIDGAAHELRTPLAELRLTAEVALHHKEASTFEDSLRQCHEIGLEMEGLVELLFQLSRNPNQPHADLKGELQPLHDALQEAAIGLQEDLDHKSLRVEYFDPGENSLLLPQSVAKLVARNLMMNAVEYTQAGGKIHFQYKASRGGCWVLSNSPVACDAKAAEMALEPFWRGDAARSDRRHHGMGLALVHHALALLGYEIFLQVEGDVFSTAIRKVRKESL